MSRVTMQIHIALFILITLVKIDENFFDDKVIETKI